MLFYGKTLTVLKFSKQNSDFLVFFYNSALSLRKSSRYFLVFFNFLLIFQLEFNVSA